MQVRSAFIGLLIVVCCAALAFADMVNDTAPGASADKGSKTFGDLLFEYDVETPSATNLSLGIEFVDPYFYVTAAGMGHVLPNKVFVFDQSGALISNFDQPGTSYWGWRDMAYDGTYLYASDSINIDAFELDGTPATGFTGVIDPNRALAYDPATDHFWTASFTSDIYEIDRSGTIINQYTNAESVYGFAWDAETQGGPWLWAFGSGTISQFDPVAGVYTGVVLDSIPATFSAQGGLTFTTEWDAYEGEPIFIGLSQGTPDIAFGAMWPRVWSYYSTSTPTVDGVINTGEYTDAYTVSITGTTVDFDLYLMGDEEMLYGAIDATGDTTQDTADKLRIYFDNNNDNAFDTSCVPGTTKDGYYDIENGGGSTLLSYITVWDNASVPTQCESLTPVAFTGAMGMTKGNVQYEFSLDMDGGEMFGGLGEIIGILFNVVDAGGATQSIWPEDGALADPMKYGDLKYQVCPDCEIGGVCYADGDTNPSNVCEKCDVATATDAWSANDGATCDDGLFCTENDACDGDTCTGDAKDCDDGLFCTGVETCNEDTDACDSAGDPCDPGTESCNEDTDSCDPLGDDDDDDDDNDDDTTDDDDDDTADDDDDDDTTPSGGDDDDDDDDGCCGC